MKTVYLLVMVLTSSGQVQTTEHMHYTTCHAKAMKALMSTKAKRAKCIAVVRAGRNIKR